MTDLLSKERIEELLSVVGLEPCDFDAVWDGLKTGEIVSLLREVKQRREAAEKPVGYIHNFQPFSGAKGSIFIIKNRHYEQGVFTAPPLPVVPDELADDSGFKDQYIDGWNACRAAMVQSGEVKS
ncbi:hypothetical protein ABRP55_20390 [Pectobacterium zantedeschiae]|uniref:hypothetical protein n=1 Tax=Pectobacterium zantedeschiae TaxID=2034769 RepID=UPI0032EF08EF